MVEPKRVSNSLLVGTAKGHKWSEREEWDGGGASEGNVAFAVSRRRRCQNGER